MEEILSERYIKGMNDGYLLARHKPELLALIMKTNQTNDEDYFKGLQAGLSEFDKENNINKLKQEYENTKRIDGNPKSKDDYQISN